MSNLPPSEKLIKVEPTREAIARRLFDYLEIESVLAAYLDDNANDEEVEAKLHELALWLAQLSAPQQPINAKLFRAAFDRLTESMNQVARKRRDSSVPKRFSGLKRRTFPEDLSFVRELDDRYWYEQFPSQYENGEMIARREDESDREYTARYAYACMHGLLFGPFTYLK